jgi:hypothetical protein
MRKCGEPRRADSTEAATARSQGGSFFREPSGISSRQEVSEPKQVGVKPRRERSRGWWLWSVGATQPLGCVSSADGASQGALSLDGWQLAARCGGLECL